MSSSEVRSLQGKKAAAVRWATADPTAISRDLAAAKLAAYIIEVTRSAPPLTDAQKTRLTTLIGAAP